MIDGDFETLSEAFLEGYADFSLNASICNRACSDTASDVIAAREYIEGFYQAVIDSEFIKDF